MFDFEKHMIWVFNFAKTSEQSCLIDTDQGTLEEWNSICLQFLWGYIPSAVIEMPLVELGVPPSVPLTDFLVLRKDVEFAFDDCFFFLRLVELDWPAESYAAVTR